MEEKLIIISYKDEILDSWEGIFPSVFSELYITDNELNILDSLEFEAFVFVNVEFK
jgi:hypothetical protein